MTTVAEKPLNVAPQYELANLPEKRASFAANILDKVAYKLLVVADSAEQRKIKTPNELLQVDSQGKEEIFVTDMMSNELGESDPFDSLLNEEPSAERKTETEPGSERFTKAKALLRRVGAGAISALRTTNEFAVGAGIIAGRGAAVAGEKIGQRAGEIKVGILEDLNERKSAAEAHKAERAADREQSKLERQHEKALVENDKFDKAEQKAYESDFEKGLAENAKFDAAVEKAEKREARAEAAKTRKAARQAKWAARKASIGLAISGAKNTAVSKYTAAKDATVTGYTTAKNSAVTGYKTGKETVTDMGRDVITKSREGAQLVAEKATGVATGVMEFGLDQYDKVAEAGERVKIEAHNIRATGAAALEYHKTLREQASLEGRSRS